MSGNKPHINYTLADIERYLQGKLSPAEMHALEKAALQDPFLADALEGYQSTDLATSKEHLDEIRRRLQPGDENTIPLIIPPKRAIKWWRIAAIALLVIGAGSIGLYLFNNTPVPAEVALHSTISKMEALPPAADSLHKTSIIADQSLPAQKTTASAGAGLKTPAAESAEETGQAPKPLAQGELAPVRDSGAIAAMLTPSTDRLQQVNESKKPEQPLSALRGKASGVEVSAANKNSANLMMRSNAVGSPPRNQHSFTGQVTDSSGRPISGAIVRIGTGGRYVAADDKGGFRFSLPDTASGIEVTAVGFESQRQQVTPEKQNHVVLREVDENLNEVIVTGQGLKRKKETTGSIQAIQPTDRNAISPENGWPAFNNYLSEKTSTARSKITGAVSTGVVDVELTLTRRGKVKEVKLLASFNASLNEVISKAIEEGPKWILADGNPATGKKKIRISL